MYCDIEFRVASDNGTVGHDASPPAGEFCRSVTGRTQSGNRKSTASSLHDAAAILRGQRLRDLLASIAEWERASGPDRVWWRRDAQHRLAEWRRLYRAPERAAFQAAVARRRA